VPSSLNHQNFEDTHKEALSKPGTFVGMYRDGDNIVLDVSVNTDNIKDAIDGAKKSNQDSIYDVKNRKTKYTEAYNLNSKGVYEHSPDAQARIDARGNNQESTGTVPNEGTPKTADEYKHAKSLGSSHSEKMK
jgi:hypothetical protein